MLDIFSNVSTVGVRGTGFYLLERLHTDAAMLGKLGLQNPSQSFVQVQVVAGIRLAQ
jgi:hypothetical protein